MKKTFIAGLFALSVGLSAVWTAAQTQETSPGETQRAVEPERGAPDQRGGSIETEPAPTPTETERAVERPDAKTPPADDAARREEGKGVATGFIAAGLGLALLGLFVRRRHHGGPGAGPRV